MSAHDVAVAGVGMHPWGKWGKNFVEYGVHAARAALADSGVDWRDVVRAHCSASWPISMTGFQRQTLRSPVSSA